MIRMRAIFLFGFLAISLAGQEKFLAFLRAWNCGVPPLLYIGAVFLICAFIIFVPCCYDRQGTKKNATNPGFVCPKWAVSRWRPEECAVEDLKNGDFAVVDRSINVDIFIGTKEECATFLAKP